MGRGDDPGLPREGTSSRPRNVLVHRAAADRGARRNHGRQQLAASPTTPITWPRPFRRPRRSEASAFTPKRFGQIGAALRRAGGRGRARAGRGASRGDPGSSPRPSSRPPMNAKSLSLQWHARIIGERSPAPRGGRSCAARKPFASMANASMIGLDAPAEASSAARPPPAAASAVRDRASHGSVSIWIVPAPDLVGHVEARPAPRARAASPLTVCSRTCGRIGASTRGLLMKSGRAPRRRVRSCRTGNGNRPPVSQHAVHLAERPRRRRRSDVPARRTGHDVEGPRRGGQRLGRGHDEHRVRQPIAAPRKRARALEHPGRRRQSADRDADPRRETGGACGRRRTRGRARCRRPSVGEREGPCRVLALRVRRTLQIRPWRSAPLRRGRVHFSILDRMRLGPFPGGRFQRTDLSGFGWRPRCSALLPKWLWERSKSADALETE